MQKLLNTNTISYAASISLGGRIATVIIEFSPKINAGLCWYISLIFMFGISYFDCLFISFFRNQFKFLILENIDLSWRSGIF